MFLLQKEENFQATICKLKTTKSDIDLMKYNLLFSSDVIHLVTFSPVSHFSLLVGHTANSRNLQLEAILTYFRDSTGYVQAEVRYTKLIHPIFFERQKRERKRANDLIEQIQE
jgi:hypothetical protein